MANPQPKQFSSSLQRHAACADRPPGHGPAAASALIAGSPRVAAQRQIIRAMFGTAAQGMEAKQGSARAATAQALRPARPPAGLPGSSAGSTVQLAAIVTTNDQSYDKNGSHVSQGQTAPPNLVNTEALAELQ